MKISFTGIHNPYLTAGNRDIMINGKTSNGENIQIPSKECLIQLDCSLSDDKFDKSEENQDLKQFYDSMHKSQLYCVDSKNPYRVKIQAHSYIMNYGDIDSAILDFKINDIPIELNKPSNRKFLPLYSFMAKLSSKISNLDSVSPEEKEMAKIMNDYVHTMAMHFIDNIME